MILAVALGTLRHLLEARSQEGARSREPEREILMCRCCFGPLPHGVPHNCLMVCSGTYVELLAAPGGFKVSLL